MTTAPMVSRVDHRWGRSLWSSRNDQRRHARGAVVLTSARLLPAQIEYLDNCGFLIIQFQDRSRRSPHPPGLQRGRFAGVRRAYLRRALRVSSTSCPGPTAPSLPLFHRVRQLRRRTCTAWSPGGVVTWRSFNATATPRSSVACSTARGDGAVATSTPPEAHSAPARLVHRYY